MFWQETFSKKRFLCKLFPRQRLNRVFLENIDHSQRLSRFGTWTYDIQTSNSYCTNGVYRIFEFTPEKTITSIENFFDFVHKSDLPLVKKATRDSLNGIPYDIEYRIITPSGKTKRVLEKVTVLCSEKDEPERIIGTIQDITGRHIRDRNFSPNNKGTSLIEDIPEIGGWKYDALTDELFCSAQIYKIFDDTPDKSKWDLQALLELIHPEDAEKARQAISDCLLGKPYKIQYRIPKKSGLLTYISSMAKPLFNNEGQVVGIIGAMQDVSCEKRLKKRLQKAYYDIDRVRKLTQVGNWKIYRDNKKVHLSNEARKIIGLQQGEKIDNCEELLKYIHPTDVDRIKDIIENPPKHPYTMDLRIIKADGSIIDVANLVETIHDSAKQKTIINGTIQNVTKQKKLLHDLKKHKSTIESLEKQFELLVDNTEDIFAIIKPGDKIHYINPATESVLRIKPCDLLGKSVLSLFKKETNQAFLKRQIDLVKGKAFGEKITSDINAEDYAGSELHLQMELTNFIPDPHLQGIVLQIRNQTEICRAQAKLAYFATHDELTGLSNHRGFENKLQALCDTEGKKTSFAVMLLHINGIGTINSELGFPYGDKLILEASKRLKDFAEDFIFISRSTGVQFALLISGMKSVSSYEAIAKKIVKLFSKPFKINIYELYVSVCIGISIFPTDEQEANFLTKFASTALRRARSIGKNVYQFYSVDASVGSFKRFILQNDLPKAIEKDQLRVHYQPLIDLKNFEILAAEALIRWEHPEWGLVPPNEFVYIAEESGFIVDMGNWTLNKVCGDYKNWLAMGLPPIKISINYSSIQFLEKNLVESVNTIINKHELDPSFLIIEITENFLLKDPEKAARDIKSLRESNIQVALDDFGSGYSGLEYLNSYNIDILKVDKSYVDNIPHNQTSLVIMKAIVELAKNLQIKTVAEGIETHEQLRFLNTFSCHTGQGFLFSKPLPADEFAKILALKTCEPAPLMDFDTEFENHREYYRIEFFSSLEASLTILEIGGRKTTVGDTNVLVKDISLGGLRFFSDINFPVKDDLILKFTTNLLGEILVVYGHPVWAKQPADYLYEYGVQFTIDENKRTALSKVLNLVQIKMRDNIGFADGSFTSIAPENYFNQFNFYKVK